MTQWQALAFAIVTNQDSDQIVYTDSNGHALQGHDPVAYFTVGVPTKGYPNIGRDWNGATWLFASTANRDLFDADPDRYAPAFGGHCAVGRAFGFSFPGSARRWRIEDGRLYVNKNLFAAAQFGLFARRIRNLADGAAETAEAGKTPPAKGPGAFEPGASE